MPMRSEAYFTGVAPEDGTGIGRNYRTWACPIKCPFPFYLIGVQCLPRGIRSSFNWGYAYFTGAEALLTPIAALHSERIWIEELFLYLCPQLSPVFLRFFHTDLVIKLDILRYVNYNDHYN